MSITSFGNTPHVAGVNPLHSNDADPLKVAELSWRSNHQTNINDRHILADGHDLFSTAGGKIHIQSEKRSRA